MVISSLEEYIGDDGEYGLLTGAFNPPHRGHVSAPDRAFLQKPSLRGVAVIPHNWSRDKNPVSIELRIEWLVKTIKEFSINPERIVVLRDAETLGSPDKLDLICNANRERLFKVVGADRASSGQRNSAQRIVLPRAYELSSTWVKEAIRSNEVERMRGEVAADVLRQIMQLGLYVE